MPDKPDHGADGQQWNRARDIQSLWLRRPVVKASYQQLVWKQSPLDATTARLALFIESQIRV